MKYGRLIDADALIKRIVDTSKAPIPGWLRAEIISAPTIEPERNMGKWIYGEHDVAMCDGYWCDKCGFFVPWDYQHKFIDFIREYKYCPNCGRKMKEGDTP